MEVSDSIFCLQIQFEYPASGPLIQEVLLTRTILDVTTTFDLVFSSDRSGDRFTGKPVSQTTGLYYYLHRWYDPSTGRFISPDPKQGKLNNPQSLNLYIYVIDDPTTLRDPSGLDWWNPFTWSQQQQAQAFTIAVIVVAVVAVVATGGIASPLAAAAVGAALSTTSYTLAAGDKATLKGAVLTAALGAVAGGAGAAVAGSSVAGNILANAAIGGTINTGSYAAAQYVSGHAITSSGLGSAFITGALAGALGAKTAGIVPQGGLTAEKLVANVGIGEVTYAVGQVIQGKPVTGGGVLENGAFSAFSSAAADELLPGHDYQGAGFSSFLGSFNNWTDAFQGTGDLWPL